MSKNFNNIGADQVGQRQKVVDAVVDAVCGQVLTEASLSQSAAMFQLPSPSIHVSLLPVPSPPSLALPTSFLPFCPSYFPFLPPLPGGPAPLNQVSGERCNL